jgi:spermidine synthase
VKPYERLAEAIAPDGSVLTLFRHDGSYQLRVNGVELMTTRRVNSEVQLAQVACAPLAEATGVHVLIGGLGFGYTTQAALDILGADARVVVAEIGGGVIAWNRNPEYGLSHVALADTRVDLRHADVLDVLRENVGAFDAIMLDVDNGAESLVTSGNAQLYTDIGIRATIAAMRPGGRIVYWSAQDDPRFVKSLTRAGLKVETRRIRAHVTVGGFYSLFIAKAQRPARQGNAGR